MKPQVLEEAERELTDAALWYEARQLGLGIKLLSAFEQSLARIHLAPESFSRLENWPGQQEIRRCPLDRFPYLVIFERSSQGLLIVAVAHVRRRPFYWRERLT